MKASIYQRDEDKKWVGQIELGRDNKGKRKRKVIYGGSKKEVEEKVNIVLYELQTDQYIGDSKDTLIEFLKDYHRICSGCDMWKSKYIYPDSAKWQKTTAELFKMYIDVHFEPYFQSTKLKDIKAITLDAFYNNKMSIERDYKIKQGNKMVTKKQKPLSINSVIKLNKFLKAAFNYAIVNDQLKKNPTSGVKLSSPEKFSPNVYDKDKFFKLLIAVRGEDEEIPVILGAGCGLRRGEMCGLTWDNIDFDKKVITIEKTQVRFNDNLEKMPKNETSKRTIIAPDYVIDTLRDYYERKNNPPKLENIITRWKPQSLSEMFSNLLKKHNLDQIRLHDLRHYNAVIMLHNGISDKVAAERLGHSNVSTLREVYQHVLKEMDEEAANKINESISFVNNKEKENKEETKEELKRSFKIV
ncbi:site-specific recombinase XerD [Lachnotalea glycerini]|uniref:Site-specific recombinase XerD n=1 Tax=Lachnotalea glycerini TaxID=1763509 RepID=A0A318ER63_9FIRM|nr:site-specific integrase [Lachnotalea glycerini]PXV85134.1 site-specific recombinase XerD [Lachnotalea glycerini]